MAKSTITGTLRQFARLHAAIHGDPFRAGIVRHFDADHHIAVAPRDLGRALADPCPGILFDVRAAAHAAADDVQHGEHASLGRD